MLWFPNQQLNIDHLASVQKRFLVYVFRRFGYSNYISFAPYDFKLYLLKIESLSSRRENACRLFVFDILSGKIDAQHILELIYINVPPIALRNYTFLNHQYHRTSYGQNEPIANLINKPL